MKYLFVFILSVCLVAGISSAYGRKHKYRGMPRTEVDLMNDVLTCLKNKDSLTYFYLFPPFDTLWHMVTHNTDHTPETIKELNELKDHPQSLIEFDPFFNHSIMARFCAVLTKGEDSGIHWNSVVIQRYELHKENLTRNLVGYEKIAPERFTGYMFVRDLLGRLTFCINITEIQKINGYFFGGQVLNILEAGNVDQFLFKEMQEQKYFEWLLKHPKIDSARKDSIMRAKMVDNDTADNDTGVKKQDLAVTNPGTDEEKNQSRKEVIDRKYYEGKFDDEIPVKLFVRYMRDVKSGKVLSYDGLYKFGDQVDYVKLNITINPEGKWVMEDDPPVGTLELGLMNKVYTGTWSNNDNQTGYDVYLKQADIEEKKMEELDRIIEKGLSGSANEESIPETKEMKKQRRRSADKGNEMD